VIVDKIVEIICEYQDFFPTKFYDLKGIIGDLGVMKITLTGCETYEKKTILP